MMKIFSISLFSATLFFGFFIGQIYQQVTDDSLKNNCNGKDCKLVNLSLDGSPSLIRFKEEKNRNSLCILCYPGQQKTLYNVWINPKVTINLSNTDQHVEVYFGTNWSSVVESSKSINLLSWSLPTLNFVNQEYRFEPFTPSCIGLLTSQNITAEVKIRNPDIWFLIYLAVGLCLFFFAQSWSRNIFLHYGTGISIGVICSVLIIVIVINRFLPQKLKVLGYSLFALSTSAFLYLWKHLLVYLQNHWQIFLGYLLVAVLVSFAVIYRYGPASDAKTLNLIQWALQGLGLIFIYHSTQVPEVSISIIIVTISLYCLPSGMFRWVNRIKYRCFPPRRKLLSEDEYIIEGEVETKKALEELREYCRSPKCDAWKTVGRLHSPNRFASFISGEDHLTEIELDQHEEIADIHYLLDDSSDSDISET